MVIIQEPILKIRYANILLQNAENYANLNDIARYVAEAKFFRAYEYFDLLRFSEMRLL